ncbi:MAG: GAF domain-containing protein [Myxococcales bacterium FL481]|nr:MAG: GAF domain-containing protein [Myxococcales bacterium FL481]
MSLADPYQPWLAELLQTHHAAAGTVHVRHQDHLELRAAINIPPPVVDATRRIPHGKGMAGLAWSRNAPVSTCNLQDDETGDVRPGAKAVDAAAAVALPVHDASGDVRAVVGIAFAQPRELAPAELASLGEAAEALPV